MAYHNPIYGIFANQKDNAKHRDIAWHLTFKQWWGIWKRSGKWKYRGKKSKQYCMSRKGDVGPYAIGNVKIVTVHRNHSEKTYHHTDKFKLEMSKRQQGNTHWLGKKHTEKSKKKISKSNKGRIGGFAGKHHSEATKELKRKNWRNQYGCSQIKGG